MTKKTLTYILLTIGMLYGIRYLIYEGLRMKKGGFYSKYNTVFCEKNEYDLLFIGSSRAETHYNTRLFDSITGLHSFNLGMKGATPRMAYMMLKLYLGKSEIPKYVIFEIDVHYLKNRGKKIMEFNNYFAFLRDRSVRDELQALDPRMKHFYLDPLYSLPFTGIKNIGTSVSGWLGKTQKYDTCYFNGYLMEVFKPSLIFKKEIREYGYIDPVERSYIDSIFKLGEQNRIKMIPVSSPLFAGGRLTMKNKESMVRQLQNIGIQNGCTYHDLSSLPFCSNRNLFVDNNHLNYQGSVIFTRYFARFFNNKYLKRPLK